jgi:hypothetical protein
MIKLVFWNENMYFHTERADLQSPLLSIIPIPLLSPLAAHENPIKDTL